MVKLLRHLHRIYSLLVLLVFSTIFYPFYYFASTHPRYYDLMNKLRKWNSFICSFFIGLVYRIKFEEELKSDQTYIYCANHTSNFDIMTLCVIAKGRFHFMGKEELLANPVLKLFFNTIDVPVKRESKISAFRAFKKAGDNLEKGMSLIIFPEGKIEDQYPPKTIPFKNGPFRLAIEKNVAIVPVSMVNIWKRMWDDGSKYGTSPGFCDIYIHKPIATQDLSIEDSDLLRDQVFDLINSKLAHK